MDILISNHSGIPIYEQITSQIKAMILSGELKAGDALPSMRRLAKSLQISVITAQRAYEDLQRDGFIETSAGLGTFVAAQSRSVIQEERQRKIEKHLEAAAEIARGSGIGVEKLVELLHLFYSGEEDQ